jgi:putative transposase
VELVDDGAVMKEMLYTLGNPVAASLVESWRHWPGVISGPRACMSEPLDIERPEVFFREDGSMPESVRLETTVPPCFVDLGAKRFATKLAKGLKAYEAEKLEDNAAEGLSILGRDAVLAQNPWDKPKSLEPRRGLNPRIACTDKWQRIEALKRLREFREAYREAWQAFKLGVRDVVWPAGTYWMRHHGGCPTVSLS